ncbi:MAG: molybdopterin-dependent oxidoreductase, partial [Thermomicrobiales bacterium]|nr:molybdopterin-dependent oxidoreductase [Thermomicrobiales bacterium]
KAMIVWNSNPLVIVPNADRAREGMARDDLFTIVHEQFLTDTAKYADIVLPATTQLEQVDLHKAYGHYFMQYNHRAIEPLGEARCNWDVMRTLAAGMGYDEPWLRQEPEEVIDEILTATRAINPLLDGITLERLQNEGPIPYARVEPGWVPFGDGVFPTLSGKVELLCEALVEKGVDALPDYVPPSEFAEPLRSDELVLFTSAAHHFTSTSMGNLPALMRKEGEPFIEINPLDAADRGISNGDRVIAANNRGEVQLRAIVTDDMPRGMALAPKGQWPKHNVDGHNINSLTSDALGDLGGQSTFHSNRVTVRILDRIGDAPPELAPASIPAK